MTTSINLAGVVAAIACALSVAGNSAPVAAQVTDETSRLALEIEARRLAAQQGVREKERQAAMTTKQRLESRHNELVTKFGKELAEVILAGRVLKDMSSEAVTEALGPPQRKERIPPNYELWIYSDNRISLKLGKVSTANALGRLPIPWGPAGPTELCSREFQHVNKENGSCRFTLSPQGAIEFDGQLVSEPLVVTVSELRDSKKTIYAESLHIFPVSNTGRFYFIVACDNKDGSGLCWNHQLFDSVDKKTRRISAWKYGPINWVRWSSDDRYGLFIMSGEGINRITAIDTLSGVAITHPGYNERQMILVEPGSFDWLESPTFQIATAQCVQPSCSEPSKDWKMTLFDLGALGLVRR